MDTQLPVPADPYRSAATFKENMVRDKNSFTLLEPQVARFVGDMTLDEFERASLSAGKTSVPALVNEEILLGCLSTTWQQQSVNEIPQGARFTITDYGGQIDMGWGPNRAVNVFGEHRDSGTVCAEAGDSFPLKQGWCRHCLVMGIQFQQDGHSVVRPYWTNDGNQPWHTSVMKNAAGMYWEAEESGLIVCLFNDEDSNNSGRMWGNMEVLDATTHFERLKTHTKDWHQRHPLFGSN